MKTIWKWILGIAILLVIIVAVWFAASNMYISRLAAEERFDNVRTPRFKNIPGEEGRSPSFGYDNSHGPHINFGRGTPLYGRRGIGMCGFGGYGYLPFSFLVFGGFVRKLFPLGVLILVAYVAYQQGKKIGAAEALLSMQAEKGESVSKKATSKTKKNE